MALQLPRERREREIRMIEDVKNLRTQNAVQNPDGQSCPLPTCPRCPPRASRPELESRGRQTYDVRPEARGNRSASIMSERRVDGSGELLNQADRRE
jgi:hypothetical protein